MIRRRQVVIAVRLTLHSSLSIASVYIRPMGPHHGLHSLSASSLLLYFSSSPVNRTLAKMRFSVLSFAVTVVAAAGFATATRTSTYILHANCAFSSDLSISSIPALKARGQQTIIAPLSGDPVGSGIALEFADEVSSQLEACLLLSS